MSPDTIGDANVERSWLVVKKRAMKSIDSNFILEAKRQRSKNLSGLKKSSRQSYFAGLITVATKPGADRDPIPRDADKNIIARNT